MCQTDAAPFSRHDGGPAQRPRFLVWYLVSWLRRRRTDGAQIRDELSAGGWIVAHLALLYLLSAFGSFDGLRLISAPWDSAIVAVVSFGVYFWGVSAGTSYLRAHPDVMRGAADSADAADPI